MSSISALKTLTSKPNIVKELSYKLEEDVRNGILVSLEDFLQLPEVKKSGINAGNCDDYIISFPLQLVTNVNSKSTPLQLCVAPNWVSKLTRQTVNGLLHTGLYGLP